MINIFGAGSNQIVIYCDAVNDFTGGFFPLTLENVFTKEVKTLNPEVIVKNTRYIKLCFNLVSSQGQEDLSLGKVYIKAQGTFDYQVGNATNFNTNISLMIGYRIVEKGEAQIELREQEVQYTKFISDNEDLEAFVFLDDDPCPDGNCPPTDCYIPVVGERYGGGLVYEVNTNTRTIFIAGIDEVEGSYDFGGFGLNIPQDMTSGLINTNNILTSVGKKGQAADIIKNRVINGYSDWYLPSMTQFQNARNILGSSFSAVDKIYWSSTQHILTNGGFSNEILNSDAFFNDNTTWQDVSRDGTLFSSIDDFGGDIPVSEAFLYPDEVQDLSPTTWIITSDNPGDILEHFITEGPLERNTFYTFRCYFLGDGWQGDLRVNLNGTPFQLPSDPRVILTFFGSEIQISETTLCEAQITPLEEDNNGRWHRLEITLPTSGLPVGGVLLTMSLTPESPAGFTWYYSSPTFRKGYYNRHGAYVRPGQFPERVMRNFPFGIENPYEGTFSTSIGGYDPDINDIQVNSFQDINLSYFTTYTHSSNITLHAANYGCRYLKVSTGTNPPYDMDSPFYIVDLDTGTPVRESRPTMNYVFNTFDVNDPRWVKSRTIPKKEYGKDVWGEYTSWLIGTTQSVEIANRFYWDIVGRSVGEDFTLSFYVKSKDNQGIEILVMNTSETVLSRFVYDPITNTFPFTPSSSYIQSYTSSVGAFGDWNRVVARIRVPSGQSTIRTNFHPYPGGTTNIHLDSSSPTLRYSPANMTANFVIGGLGARYLETVANDTHILQTQVGGGFPVVSGLAYRYSFYVRPVGTRNIEILFIQNASGSVRFNLSTGTVMSGSGRIVAWENGWWRVSTSFTATGTGNVRSLIYSVNGTNTTFVGSTSSGFDIWGFQIERGILETALVETFNVPVTVQRNIEICGVQIEPGLTASEPIFTDGLTHLFRPDGFSSFSGVSGNPTISQAPTILAPDGTAAWRFQWGATYTAIQSVMTNVLASTDYVFSTYVKAGTSSVIPGFSLEFDNAPAGSTQQGSNFAWNGSTPTTTSTKAGVRNINENGWFQVWHTIRFPSGSIPNIDAEIRSTANTAGNFFLWNPLVEVGLTPSILPKVVRRPALFYDTPISKTWNRLDMGSLTNIYRLGNHRLTFTPMKNETGSSTASTSAVIVFGAQATNQDAWTSLYPIQNFSQRTFIPIANTETATQGYYTAQAFNPVRNRAHFYRKDLYFGIKGFRQENY